MKQQCILFQKLKKNWKVSVVNFELSWFELPPPGQNLIKIIKNWLWDYHRTIILYLINLNVDNMSKQQKICIILFNQASITI